MSYQIPGKREFQSAFLTSKAVDLLQRLRRHRWTGCRRSWSTESACSGSRSIATREPAIGGMNRKGMRHRRTIPACEESVPLRPMRRCRNPPDKFARCECDTDVGMFARAIRRHQSANRFVRLRSTSQNPTSHATFPRSARPMKFRSLILGMTVESSASDEPSPWNQTTSG